VNPSLVLHEIVCADELSSAHVVRLNHEIITHSILNERKETWRPVLNYQVFLFGRGSA